MSKKTIASTTTASDNIDLAWKLAKATEPHLSALERNRIYIAIGIGETFSMIDALLTVVAWEQVPLNVDLVDTVTTWLDCHAGHDAEPRLREFLSQVKAISAQQVSATDQPSRYWSMSAEYGPGRVMQTQFGISGAGKRALT